jgi:hypothetical protein
LAAKPSTPDILTVSRIFKSIRLLFLLFAGMALLFHMIIPHDHHFSCPESGVRDSCPVQNERSDHHPLLPGHCHAFNDLAAEKFSPVIIRQYNQYGIATIIWLPDYIIPGVHISPTILPASDKPFQQIFIPDLFPFRGPPVIS